MKPQNFEEKLVWYSLISIYGLYILALQYLVFSTLAWLLFFYLGWKIWLGLDKKRETDPIHIPWILWLWIICMIIIGFATVVGLSDFGYDNKTIIREVLNWTRDWALLALFPLAGCCLKIRPQLVYRASCIVCLQSLFAIPICALAYTLDLPATLYSSPLEKITQNGPIYYAVLLYIKDVDSGGLRITLFAPWAPALGLVSCFYFIFAFQETDRRWRWIGILGSTLMIFMSATRSAFINLPIAFLITWLLKNFTNPYTQIGGGILSFFTGIFSSTLLTTVKDGIDSFKEARKSSSELREILQRIAFERWKEAPIWGHGKQIPGPPVLKHMPIGSHHTWIGLLFSQGLVGFFAFLIPVLCTSAVLISKIYKSEIAGVGLRLLLILMLFTPVDNQEKLAYLYWPGLIVIGCAFRDKTDESQHTPVEQKLDLPSPI